MRASRFSIPATGLVLLLLAVSCSNPATGKPEATVREAEPTPAATTMAAAAPQERRFVISEESTVSFVGSKVTGSHDGGFKGVDGEIVVAGGDPTQSRVTVDIDTTSIWSDTERLTGHLKSPDFFDVEKFPTARFTSTSIVPDGAGYRIDGNLDLHGVTKNISFPATIELADDAVKAKAEFVLKRFDWGIVYPGKADDLIRDEVVVRLDLTGVPG
jgi:polyisoprenoid-binding protein YceI